MNMDQELDKDDYRNALHERSGVHLNCAATKEHVGQIECNIRTEKERFQATFSWLPHEKLPLLMANDLVTEVAK